MRNHKLVLFLILSVVLLLIVACQGSIYSRMGGKTGMAFFPGPSGSNVYCEDPDDSRTYPYWDPSFVPLAKESFKRATTVTGVHYQQPGVIISRGDRCIQEGDSSLTSPDEVSRGAQVGALVEYFCQDNLIVNHFNAYCKSEFDYSYGCESGRCVKQYPEFSILSVLSAPSVYSPNKQVFWLKLFDTGKNIIPAGNIIKVCRKESLQQSSCDKIYEFRSLGIQGHTFPPEMLIGYNTLSPIRVFIGTSTDFDKYNPNNNWDDAPLTNPIRDAYFIVDPFNEYQELDESNNVFHFVEERPLSPSYPADILSRCSSTKEFPPGGENYHDQYGFEYCTSTGSSGGGIFKSNGWIMKKGEYIIEDIWQTFGSDQVNEDVLKAYFAKMKSNLLLKKINFGSLNYPVYTGNGDQGNLPNGDKSVYMLLIKGGGTQLQVRVFLCKNVIMDNVEGCQAILEDYIVREYLDCNTGNWGFDQDIDPRSPCLCKDTDDTSIDPVGSYKTSAYILTTSGKGDTPLLTRDVCQNDAVLTEYSCSDDGKSSVHTTFDCGTLPDASYFCSDRRCAQKIPSATSSSASPAPFAKNVVITDQAAEALIAQYEEK